MRKIGAVDKCEKCGKEYIIRAGNQRFCPECSASDIARRASNKYYRKNKVEARERECVSCGRVFLPPDNRSITCSVECREKRRAQLKKECYEKNREAIAERKRQWRKSRKETQNESSSVDDG